MSTGMLSLLSSMTPMMRRLRNSSRLQTLVRLHQGSIPFKQNTTNILSVQKTQFYVLIYFLFYLQQME